MFATRVLCEVVKKSTGIVGIPVVKNAKAVLIDLYNQTLQEIKAIPETAEYRKNVESLTNYRLNTIKTADSLKNAEEQIGCGQAEELILQAKDELALLHEYAEWKAWESPKAKLE
ncbi:hypothetical protein WA158_000271 [Blastocystis sp. Blastoise]